MENYEQPIYEQPVYEQPTYQQPSYQSKPKPVKEKKPSMAKTFLAGFLGALLACGLFFGATNALGIGRGKAVLGSSSITNIAATDTDSTLPEAVAAKCLPSVVSVTVYSKQSSSYGSLLEYYFGSRGKSDSEELQQSSLGSGVVLSKDGYIITNNHVVEGADALKVTIEGVEYEAALVGTDASSDVAVIKVTNANGTEFTPIEIGDSNNLTIGEWVMTIGNPFGLEQSVATGIVSATNRSQVYDSSESGYGQSAPTVYTNMIQTDAAINPGNSGGALVNAQGQLIGINTLITSYSGNYSGVGFAIPVNYALGLAQDIIEGKTPSHAQLGVSTVTVNQSLAKRYEFKVSSGAYVSTVSAGSAADKAGIQEGDIITKIDSSAISSSSDVMLAVRSKSAGDTIEITLDRDGQTVTVKATLGSDASK